VWLVDTDSFSRRVLMWTWFSRASLLTKFVGNYPVLGYDLDTDNYNFV